jgi:hypothetical protein
LRHLQLTSFAAVAALSLVPVAAASVGDPPRAMSPIAGSIYRAQFALCSLETLNGLASKQGMSIQTLSVGGAALRLARAREGDLGSAAVRGCRNGLLYRHSHDQVVTGLRSELKSRVSAEKYVAAVYMIFTVMFFLWVLIHALKVARLNREVRALLDQQVYDRGRDVTTT